MGRIRADKNKPYSIYLVSTKETMMYILKNLNGLIRVKVPSFKEGCNLYNIDYIEPMRPCANGDNYYKGLFHIFSFFSPNSTAILSYELMSIQSAGNQRVSRITPSRILRD